MKEPRLHSLIHLLHRASQAADALFADQLGEMTITPRQWVVLAALAAEEGASQTDLVARTGIDRSTIADIVRRLQNSGHLKRRRSKDDARAYVVEITASGRRAFEAGQAAVANVDDMLLRDLPARSRNDLRDALAALTQNTSS